MTSVWCADDTFLNDLIFLDDRSLIVDRTKEEQAETQKAALMSGQSPASVLSSDCLYIPLTSVVRISTDRHDEDIEIAYKADDEVKEQTLRLSSPEIRDQVFATLKQIYGDRFEEFEEAYSRPQAAFGPLMALTITAALSWLLAAAASELRGAESYEISGSRQGLKALLAGTLEFVGPIGVYVVGGLIGLLSALLLIKNLQQPPLMVTLQEPPYKKQSAVKLVGKYAILGVVWFYAAKLLLV